VSPHPPPVSAPMTRASRRTAEEEGRSGGEHGRARKDKTGMVRMAPDIDSDFRGCGWRLEEVNTLSILHSYAYCYITYAIWIVPVGVSLSRVIRALPNLSIHILISLTRKTPLNHCVPKKVVPKLTSLSAISTPGSLSLEKIQCLHHEQCCCWLLLLFSLRLLHYLLVFISTLLNDFFKSV
jgi:hypothetical protein